MLPRSNRLAEDKDFNRLFKGGRSAHGAGVSVRFVANRLPESRVAFIVSTKTAKAAVVRNKLKRRMRVIVRSLLPRLVKGADIALTAKSEAKTMSFEDLKKSLTDLLRRQRLLS